MKGLILSGGKGTRLRPLTHTSAKQLVPVANKPVLFYGIESLVEAGVTDIGIIVGDTAESIKEAVGDGEVWHATITYIHQEAPLGLAHAVKIAQQFIGDDTFIMYLGDNIIETSIRPFVKAYDRVDRMCNCLLMLKEVDRPQQYGIALVDAEEPSRVVRVVEKPQQYMGNLALMGIYLFDSTIFKAIEQIQPSWRNELEITDAIQRLIDMGHVVNAQTIEGRWIDTGAFEDMLEGNKVILEGIEPKIQGLIDAGSDIRGKAVIPETSRIINSTILGPVVIGENCWIENSCIGPFASIANGCSVRNSTVSHSILMEGCCIIDMPGRIEGSLIGRHVVLEKSSVDPSVYKLLLGDNSKVGV